MPEAGNVRSLVMRSRIIEGAVEVVADDGVAASTAVIAKHVGVAQGSVFHHFETKAGLLDAVFAVLKKELREAVIADLDDALPLEDKLWLIWQRWTDWGTRNPARRRALLLIGVSDYVSSQTRQESELESIVGVKLFKEASRTGVLRQQSIRFVGALVEAVANSTMDMMALEPARADEYRLAGFRAMRNMLG